MHTNLYIEGLRVSMDEKLAEAQRHSQLKLAHRDLPHPGSALSVPLHPHLLLRHLAHALIGTRA